MDSRFNHDTIGHVADPDLRTRDIDGVGALQGVRVLDFSRVLAGPYATMLMADLGAEVIKVERPGTGDDTRSWGPPWFEGRSTYFLSVNRNKQSIRVDLQDPSERDRLIELVRTADVIIENFRPGTMERFGLHETAVRAMNPRAIYCSISGFGSGAGADLAGYDLVVQAAGGLMSLTGDAESGPLKAGVALVDVITGLHALAGILAALRHRDQTGEGQKVEVNLMSSLLSALTNQASAYLANGSDPAPMGNTHPSIAPYEVFDTADRSIAIAAPNNKLFGALCRALKRADLTEDERFATNSSRVAHRRSLSAELNSVLRSRPADEWFTVLRVAGVPCGPINTVGQAFELAELLDLAPVTHPRHSDGGPGVAQVRCPIGLSATPAKHITDPPA